MDSEEKNLNDTLTEMVKVDISSGNETINDELNSTKKIENENNTYDNNIEIKDEDLDTNVDEVINNIENKEENNVDDIVTSNTEDGSNNVNENKNNKTLLIILVILILVILGVGAYIVYDKFIKDSDNKKSNNNVTPTPSITPTVTDITPTPNVINYEENVIEIEIKDNMLYINGNKVDFYNKSDYKNKYNDELSFYNARGEYSKYNTQYEYKVIGDVVFVKTYILDYYESEYYFVDLNGNIIKKINGTNPDITLSVNDENLQVMINRVKNNEIYFEVYKNSKIMDATGGSICSLRYNSTKMKDVYYYIDKITYLGNNEFKVEQKVETKMYDDYMLEWEPFIDCSPYTMKFSKYGYLVQNIDNYYVDIENDVLKLVDGNGNLISELAKLENSSDFILAMEPGARYMKVEDNTKICSVSKDGIYVFMGSNRSLGDMHTDYSHMHVIYYDINTGEKSELIRADAEGHFGDLATCR